MRESRSRQSCEHGWGKVYLPGELHFVDVMHFKKPKECGLEGRAVLWRSRHLH
jgi:hypothetical protein